jgi:hypothetical protein
MADLEVSVDAAPVGAFRRRRSSAGAKVASCAQEAWATRACAVCSHVGAVALFVDAGAGRRGHGHGGAWARGCRGGGLRRQLGRGRRRVCSHAVYWEARGRMRGQRIGVRRAATEGQVVGGLHYEGGAHAGPMFVDEQEAGADM